ncbi:MAG: chromosome segregation protein SMC [Desulfomonile tiedjei]|nr:chromosome segregation protein SMC [Desulfomonile tiedjei]
MNIKRLEILGFKSFPDKTVFEFRPGITAVVGPNGCGKSNVFEAIRWVMGEQRVRSLRSKKMEDVIFNGSETRKPVGMAEVRLVLSNSEGLAPPSMADYDEIMITRRLFRDGESHYEINNISCRLADVTDLFLDTGVGRNSYAIIEQGQVDFVVAAKPEERRVLIEEAAGIVRYKSRKEAALKKLELTRQNLIRISDVVSEVKRQSVSLKRQAARAERYVKLSERIRELDVSLHAYRCNEFMEQLSLLHADLSAKRRTLVDAEARVSVIQARLEADRLKALETERELKEILETRHATELELARVRNRMETDRTTLTRIDERQKHLRAEQQTLEGRIEHARSVSEELEKNQAAVQADLEAATRTLQQELNAADETERELSVGRTRVDQLKDDIFRTLQETAQQRNQRESIEKRKAEIKSSGDRIAADSQAIQGRLTSDRRELDLLTENIAETTSSLQESRNLRQQLSQQRNDTALRIAALRKDLSQAEKELAGNLARLQSLEEMQRDYSAYDRSVQFLMKEQEPLDSGDLWGPLAEVIEVAPEYQRALTGKLGDRLSHLVVSSPRDGITAANKLKEAGVGRATFIPVEPRCSPEAESSGEPAGLLRLRDVVRFRDGFEQLGGFLLDGCFVAESMEQAVQLWEQNGIRVDLVTRGGEVINRYGEITGGTTEKGAEEVFEKRREIAELKAKGIGLETAIEQTRSSLEAEEGALEGLVKDIEANDRRLNELNLKEVRLRKDRERLDSQISGSQRRIEVFAQENQRLAAEVETLSAQFETCRAAITSLEQARLALEEQKTETQADVERLGLKARERSQQTEEMKVRLAQLEERSRSIERECRSARENRAQLENQRAALTRQMTDNEAEKTRLLEQTAHTEAREKELMATHQGQAARVETLKTGAADLSSRVRTLEEQSGAGARLVRELREAVHGLEMESVRVEQILEDLVEKILERHHVDPRTAAVPEVLPDEGEMAEIRDKLAAMGEVNLAARAESRLIEERLTFLLEQEDDLQKAVDSLYATINAINKTTKERFRQAFDAVNEQFQEIFPFLFKGGEARLELTNAQDLLETGVEILARPPGKRIQNMDLLSGGEKALTAVALIFSIFLTKPSPFCLLDEVDAPLDDANLSRFNEMLRKLSDRTQFFVVTHNKRSMQEADSLYGVTMEDAGTSRVVSVEFME